MPVHKVKGGYRYGHPGHGHVVFKSKAKAMQQARAIGLSKARAAGITVPKLRGAKMKKRRQ